MIIQHNMSSMNSNRQLGITENLTSKSTEKLSSGYRINRAADDAAGLALSEKMRSQVRGLTQASTNAQDGISLIQTAEGALAEQHSILQRTRELVVQASNSAVLDADKTGDGIDAANSDYKKIQDEINELQKEFERINTDTEFNKKKLLNGDFDEGQWLQVGANDGQGFTVAITTTNWEEDEISVLREVTDDSDEVISKVDQKINSVSAARSKLGALQNRLEHTVKVDDNAAENLQAAESRIRDVDMAEEMTKYTKYNILTQAGTSMLAQANQQNQNVLSLF